MEKLKTIYINSYGDYFKMKKLVIFKSPTCGPCKLFAPMVKQAAESIEAEYIEIDVSTEDGLKFASENGITHSGCAWYEVDNEIKIRWDKPVPATKLLADINNL
jgi:thiol-disulfide isomerase/thioredoxin